MSTTTTDDKASPRPLPADCLAAIFDRDTSYLYLYAQGKYETPALTSFVELPWIGARKFEFQGLYLIGSEGGTPTEHQYAQKFPAGSTPHFPLKSVLIVVADGEGGKTKTIVVPVETVTLFQGEGPSA
ncbi:hypothetical protein AYL99_00237 [Fonsecaea erecta]|uniref:Uncharacterized protein n=1 Tax=Fonsecaea erecta TaxID=1367422 RepID=A0A178ZZ17_9EURO|nr:hypothetical protein AYL99_00237 [Fonsecaea erecta]OAP64265.1 hypothetical protein AYL99_00237 [Fonsecaea erecta]